MRTLDARIHPELLEELLERRRETNAEIEVRARAILERVRREGDAAVLDYTRQFDGPASAAAGLRVPEAEIEEAARRADVTFLRALGTAARNIHRYHRKQRARSWTLRTAGLRLRQRFLPLERVGIYVPGGKAAYPSTVLMNAIPARIAGVREIAMASPASRDGEIRPEVLAAAAECGITEVYRVGGVQAIGALAYGTATIRPVEKITGPGNAYVAAAKRLVFGEVGIDAVAGPSEIVVVADESAPPQFVAADLLAQAEHDETATAICLTTSEELAERVRSELRRQLEALPRRAIAAAALEARGAMVLVSSLYQAAAFINALAPEHLEVMVAHPRRFAERIRKAGAVFLGPWSMEALGDYLAGPNHTLPTQGAARFSSALSVADFLRFSSIIEASRAGSLRLAPQVEALAAVEGLAGHAASARVRREQTC